jgi:hypothetical protein
MVIHGQPTTTIRVFGRWRFQPDMTRISATNDVALKRLEATCEQRGSVSCLVHFSKSRGAQAWGERMLDTRLCAHQAIGPGELGAGCRAMKTGRDRGWLSPGAGRFVLDTFSRSPLGWIHALADTDLARRTAARIPVAVRAPVIARTGKMAHWCGRQQRGSGAPPLA